MLDLGRTTLLGSGHFAVSAGYSIHSPGNDTKFREEKHPRYSFPVSSFAHNRLIYKTSTWTDRFLAGSA